MVGEEIEEGSVPEAVEGLIRGEGFAKGLKEAVTVLNIKLACFQVESFA